MLTNSVVVFVTIIQRVDSHSRDELMVRESAGFCCQVPANPALRR